MNPREDAVLLELLEAELETHMASLGQGLIALESDPTQSHLYEPLMRAAHSIKGASSLFDLKSAVKLSHMIEETFDGAREGRLEVTSDLVDVLFTGVDLLGRVARVDDDTASQTGEIDVVLNMIEEASKGRPKAPTNVNSDRVHHPANLNVAWVEDVHKRIGQWIDSGTTDLIINLDQVKHIDPAGLALLVMASSPSDAERRLVLNNAPQSLVALLSGMGVAPAINPVRHH